MRERPEVRVYVDSNIVRHTGAYGFRWLPEEVTLQWGPHTIVQTVCRRYEIVDRMVEQADERLRKETVAARLLSQFDRLPNVTFMQHWETDWEWRRRDSSWPGIGSPFRGVNMVEADSPVERFRVVAGRGAPEPERIFDGIDHSRFVFLQQLAGVQPGMSAKKRASQLMDAWHLWCAEHNACDYFLTMDAKLIRLVGAPRRCSSQEPYGVQLLKPSVLLRRMVDYSGYWSLLSLMLRGLVAMGRDRKVAGEYDLLRDGVPMSLARKGSARSTDRACNARDPDVCTPD